MAKVIWVPQSLRNTSQRRWQEFYAVLVGHSTVLEAAVYTGSAGAEVEARVSWWSVKIAEDPLFSSSSQILQCRVAKRQRWGVGRYVGGSLKGVSLSPYQGLGLGERPSRKDFHPGGS